MEMKFSKIGELIRQERKAQGLTIKNFAKLIGVSTTTIQRIETGAKSPTIDILAEISAVCRKPIDEFIQGERNDYYQIDKKSQKIIQKKDYEINVIFPYGLISRDIGVNYFKGKAGAYVEPLQIKGFDWVYIIKGSCIFKHNGHSHKLKKGDAIYYDSQKPQSLKILTDLESIRISMRM
jgi:transcriptional regulator with XRE-family HTH domain